jgi:hypothetical protein
MPKIIDSVTLRKQCGCGDIYVTFIGKPVVRMEAHGGKWGTCLAVNMRSNQSLINEMLKNNKTLNDILDIINNTHCFRMRKPTDRWVYSCVDAIAHAIQYYLKLISDPNFDALDKGLNKCG